ncbi:hypothetical protein ACFFRR_010081 [Megaselia abdita]
MQALLQGNLTIQTVADLVGLVCAIFFGGASSDIRDRCPSHLSCCLRNISTILESAYSQIGPKIIRSTFLPNTFRRFLSDSDNVHDSAPYIRTGIIYKTLDV